MRLVVLRLVEVLADFALSLSTTFTSAVKVVPRLGLLALVTVLSFHNKKELHPIMWM